MRDTVAEGVVVEFRTVGELRRALEGAPDERQLMSQVVAADGSAWNLSGRVVPNVEGSGRSLAAISLTHRDLLALHGQPFGFTWDDVDALLDAAQQMPTFGGGPTGEDIPDPALTDLAARITALLPPRPE